VQPGRGECAILCAVAKVAVEPLSVTQFLDWDGEDDRHYELVEGAPVAMAPPGPAHRVLVGNLVRRIGEALDSRPRCVVQVEAGITPVDRTDTCHQADLAVTCRPPEPGELLIADPLLVVEVLSPSTEDRDRKVKLPDYRAIPSVAEVVLLDSQRMYCEVHRRLDESRWLVDLLRQPEAVLKLDSIGFARPLGVLYANVPLAAELA
jgi:Uma2 family endonuclease